MNKVIQKLSIVLISPLLITSLSYFLFLSKPDVFSEFIEKYEYQSFSFNFEKIATNKNPIYPEIIFENLILSNESEKILISELRIGINLLGYFFDQFEKIDYLKIYTSKISVKDYISLIPYESEDLIKTLSNIIHLGDIDKLYLEFINGEVSRINNEVILSNVNLKIGANRNLFAKKAYVTADSKEVKVILENGIFENLPFERISGLLEIDTMEMKYFSYHKSINEYAKSILPLGALNFKKDIELNTSGFINFKSNYNKNFGFISFQDLSKIKYLQDGFNIRTKIFIEDFDSIFSQNLISFNDFEVNLFLSGDEIQKESTFKFFSDDQSSVDLSGTFLNGNLIVNFNHENLKGSLIRDNSNFFRLNLDNSKINFDLKNTNNEDFILPNLKFRIVGKDISLNDAKFDLIDFYYLKNGEILTLNDIKIKSEFLTISNYKNEPAYFSINTAKDLYKVKGSYEFNYLQDSLEISNFPSINYLRSNINIQWNNLLELKNMEGSLNFLAKDFQINQNNPNSALLNLVGLLNIQSLFDGYDGSSTDQYIKFKRGEGSIIFSQKYGRIKEDFKFESDFGEMQWSGFIVKDNEGTFKDLDLNLFLKLNLQENIPWYAAIFGGLGLAAGTAIIGNVFEEQINEISTIQYRVKGTLEKPRLERVRGE